MKWMPRSFADGPCGKKMKTVNVKSFWKKIGINMRIMEISCEKKGSATVAWIKGTKHRFYEDSLYVLHL